MGKLLGLDVGEKRIGVAVADTSLGMAFPRTVITRTTDEIALNEICEFIKSENASAIVVGEPLNEDNEPTVRSQAIHLFIDKLRGLAPECEIHFVDEHMTSKEALSRIPFKRDRKVKGADDAIAAAIILERYLVSAVGIEPTTLGL